MRADGQPSWIIHEDASIPVLLAMWLRDSLGIESPAGLPRLRGVQPAAIGPREPAQQERLERQWLEWWTMCVEPEAHPSPVPLQLVDEFGTWVAAPTSGADDLIDAIRPQAPAALAWVEDAHQTHGRTAIARNSANAYRAYAGTIAEHEREVGRRAHSFELNVEVLPLVERGIWWIGSLTIAVTDTLRADAAAFDQALHPIIAELA